MGTEEYVIITPTELFGVCTLFLFEFLAVSFSHFFLCFGGLFTNTGKLAFVLFLNSRKLCNHREKGYWR
jgi:hypothetical protein